MKTEIWKDILGYEGKYQVSNQGRVKSLERITPNGQGVRLVCERILRPQLTKGYQIVTLCNNGKTKIYLVHRLVGSTFIPNPDNLPEINHKDEDKTNNTVENLEWCTQAYNNTYGTRVQRLSKKISKPIICIEINKVFQSAIEAEEWIGRKGTKAGICMCLKGKSKTAYGYHWKYVE